MKTLIIDTSSEYCILAVTEEQRILTHTFFLHENRLSRSLLPEISSLLTKLNFSLAELDYIALGTGPGSYTGTRVGAAVAKSLAYGLHIPLRGFCSLIAFLPARLGRFASVLPAKSGLFYLLKGEKSDDCIQLINAGLLTKDELVEQIQDVDFVSGREREDTRKDTKQDLPLFSKEFFPFHPLPENIPLALCSPPRFAFETDAQLIYLHTP